MRVDAKLDEPEITAIQVAAPDPSCAQWLPALEHPAGFSQDHIPPLLYTKGKNAGGYENNMNSLECEVYLCLDI